MRLKHDKNDVSILTLVARYHFIIQFAGYHVLFPFGGVSPIVFVLLFVVDENGDSLNAMKIYIMLKLLLIQIAYFILNNIETVTVI